MTTKQTLPLAELHELWEKLRDVPTTENADSVNTIDEKFLNFDAGTPCEDIWHWFERQNSSFIVGEVMQGIRRTEHSVYGTTEVSYKNPWHKPDQSQYGPAFYRTSVKPTEHAGHLIYERIEGHVWDVVRDGACVTQRAGLNGAKAGAEEAQRSMPVPTERKVAGPSM